MNAVRTSDINTAMVACLNHNGFQTIDPLRDPITHEFHQTFKATSNHVGIHAMAYIAQAGFAFFEQNLLRKYSSFGARTKKDKDIAYDEDRDDDDTIADTTTLISALLTLEKNVVLPTIADLMPFLKQAFSGMPKEDLALFQSILMDIWVLQPWTRRLDYNEERLITKMEQRPPAEDLAEDENEEGDKNKDEEKTFANLIFETIETSQVQSAVNATAGTPKSSVPSAVHATASTPKSSKTSTSSSVSSNTKKTPISAVKTMGEVNEGVYSNRKLDNTSTREGTGKIGKKAKHRLQQHGSDDDEDEEYDNEDGQPAKRSKSAAIEGEDDEDSDEDTVDSKGNNDDKYLPTLRRIYIMLTKKSLDEIETKALPVKTSTKSSNAGNKKKASESQLKKAAKKPDKTAGTDKKLTKTAESSKGEAKGKRKRGV
jgi:hypothetical protein